MGFQREETQAVHQGDEQFPILQPLPYTHRVGQYGERFMAKITEQLIAEILQQVGGKKNVVACGNCMTRLRLTLSNDQLVDRDKLKVLPGVLGVMNTEEQLQIVLGTGKAQTAAEMMNTLLASGAVNDAEGPAIDAVARDNKQKIKASQTSAVHHFLAKFATIFTPLIPGFIAAGMLLGFATLLEQSLLANAAEKNGTLVQIGG